MRGPDRVEQRIDRVRLPDVGGMRRRLEPAVREFGHERIELAAIAADQCDMRAQSREQPGDRPPDAAGAARDDDDLIRQRTSCEHGRMNRKFFIGRAAVSPAAIDQS